jgi:hypothetical protein
VTRTDQFTRWTDGSVHLWRGRRSGAGRGEQSSGLAFDTLEDGPGRTGGGDDDALAGRRRGGLAVTAVEPDSPGGPTERLTDEVVVFTNEGPTTLDLTDWTVEDEVGHRYTFPAGTTLDPTATLSLRTGHGTDTDLDRYWGRRRSVWNDDGDTVSVYDADGDLVTRHGYPFPSDPLRATSVELASIDADAPGDDRDALEDESITFENAGDDAIDVSGWVVADRAGHAYTVPEGTTLPAGGRLTLHTGRGTDTETDHYWGHPSPVWNNDRDMVLVYGTDGTLVLRQVFREGSELVP